ncbi:ExbD/TolR family protein [Crateriforma spongiae]|uniref:ExbD/TolR family protein n=1 Tax=Crateriforma spongiae TaxID=2724528 RepID=UPI0028F424E5|nr:biopolymer transporter ExbD [Crateriforma spongiae]
MSIPLTCENCGSTHSVNQRMAGKDIRCPECDQLIHVPDEVDSPAEPVVEAADLPVAEPSEEVPVDVIAAVDQGGQERWANEPAAEALDAAVAVPLAVAQAIPVAGADDEQSVAGTPVPEGWDDDDVADELADSLKREPKEQEELDMTPMVDVTFLLLIFFMVTASFSLQKSIEMPRQTSDLPSTANEEEILDELDVVELEIDQHGSFLVLAPDWERETPGKQNLTNTLKEAIAGRRDGMKLNIRVHEEAKLQALVDGMDAGTIAGYTEIKVAQVDGFD